MVFVLVWYEGERVRGNGEGFFCFLSFFLSFFLFFSFLFFSSKMDEESGGDLCLLEGVLLGCFERVFLYLFFFFFLRGRGRGNFLESCLFVYIYIHIFLEFRWWRVGVWLFGVLGF